MEWRGTPVFVQQTIPETSARQESIFVIGTDVRMEAHAMSTDAGTVVCVPLVTRVIDASTTLTSVMETLV